MMKGFMGTLPLTLDPPDLFHDHREESHCPLSHPLYTPGICCDWYSATGDTQTWEGKTEGVRHYHHRLSLCDTPLLTR